MVELNNCWVGAKQQPLTHSLLLCVFTFWIPYWDVRYDFRIKTMFSSSLSPVVCRRARVLSPVIYVISVCLHIVVSNTYCVVFVFLSWSCVSCVASFSALSLRYSLTFISLQINIKKFKRCYTNAIFYYTLRSFYSVSGIYR